MRRQQVSMRALGIDPKQINKAALKIVQTLHKNDHEAYLVGGAVRDLLLGHAPKDFDVATSARPEQVRKLFRRAWIIGRRFQLVHVRIKNELIEVSTFRSPPDSQGKDFRGQLLDDNTFGSASEDALRRDLTINALMLEPEQGVIYDYVNGIADIQSRVLRIIGSPQVRYREDPVRMLRVLRLAAKLQCKVASASLHAIDECAHMLAHIVPSRLLEEVIKLVYCGNAKYGFDLLRRHHLLPHLFPHTQNFDAQQWKFSAAALEKNDRLISDRQRISLSFALSALYWPTASSQWQQLAANGKRAHMGHMRTLYEQAGVWNNQMLTRTIKAKIWDIWEAQARFHSLYKRRKALAIKNSYRTQKGLNFLQLRHSFDEVSDDKIQWWEDFISAKSAQREDMVPTARTPKSRGTRKPGPAEPPADG